MSAVAIRPTVAGKNDDLYPALQSFGIRGGSGYPAQVLGGRSLPYPTLQSAVRLLVLGCIRIVSTVEIGLKQTGM